ncbi:MAG: Rrf2 family transcriptional regulator [Verrucomicrobia bacterium]|nr:Rrf2 family transcriptional regulator [Verrucomicrobiota bacterium]
MLTKKAKYALLALIYLAKHQNEGPVLIEQLATEENIPRKFLEQILLDLKNSGILQSKKGKGGGYSLQASTDKIMVGSVLRQIDGPLAPVPCVSKTAYSKCKECKDETTCAIRVVMKEVRDAIANILDNTSLTDMLKMSTDGKKVPDYVI